MTPSGVSPDARRSSTSVTRMRIPRTHGRPPHWVGLTVILSATSIQRTLRLRSHFFRILNVVSGLALWSVAGGQASAGLWTWAGLRCDVHWSRPLPAGWEVRGGRRQGTASPLSRRRPLPKPAFGRRFANTYRGRLSACPQFLLIRPGVRPITLRSRVWAAQAKTGSTLSGPSDGPIPGSAAQTTANA